MYTEAQQILDITGINIEENSEHKKYFEAILKTDETIFNNESIESKLLAKLLDFAFIKSNQKIIALLIPKLLGKPPELSYWNLKLIEAAKYGLASIVQELLKQLHLSQDQVFKAYDSAKDTTLKKSLRDSILDSIKKAPETLNTMSTISKHSESFFWHIKRQAPYENGEDIRQNYLSRFVMIDRVKSGTALIVLAIGVSMAATAQILAASLSLAGTILVSASLILFSLLYLIYKISSHCDAYQESKTNLSPTITNN